MYKGPRLSDAPALQLGNEFDNETFYGVPDQFVARKGDVITGIRIPSDMGPLFINKSDLVFRKAEDQKGNKLDGFWEVSFNSDETNKVTGYWAEGAYEANFFKKDLVSSWQKFQMELYTGGLVEDNKISQFSSRIFVPSGYIKSIEPTPAVRPDGMLDLYGNSDTLSVEVPLEKGKKGIINVDINSVLNLPFNEDENTGTKTIDRVGLLEKDEVGIMLDKPLYRVYGIDGELDNETVMTPEEVKNQFREATLEFQKSDVDATYIDVPFDDIDGTTSDQKGIILGAKSIDHDSSLDAKLILPVSAFENDLGEGLPRFEDTGKINFFKLAKQADDTGIRAKLDKPLYQIEGVGGMPTETSSMKTHQIASYFANRSAGEMSRYDAIENVKVMNSVFDNETEAFENARQKLRNADNKIRFDVPTADLLEFDEQKDAYRVSFIQNGRTDLLLIPRDMFTEKGLIVHGTHKNVTVEVEKGTSFDWSIRSENPDGLPMDAEDVKVYFDERCETLAKPAEFITNSQLHEFIEEHYSYTDDVTSKFMAYMSNNAGKSLDFFRRLYTKDEIMNGINKFFEYDKNGIGVDDVVELSAKLDRAFDAYKHSNLDMIKLSGQEYATLLKGRTTTKIRESDGNHMSGHRPTVIYVDGSVVSIPNNTIDISPDSQGYYTLLLTQPHYDALDAEGNKALVSAETIVKYFDERVKEREAADERRDAKLEAKNAEAVSEKKDMTFKFPIESINGFSSGGSMLDIRMVNNGREEFASIPVECVQSELQTKVNSHAMGIDSLGLLEARAKNVKEFSFIPKDITGEGKPIAIHGEGGPRYETLEHVKDYFDNVMEQKSKPAEFVTDLQLATFLQGNYIQNERAINRLIQNMDHSKRVGERTLFTKQDVTKMLQSNFVTDMSGSPTHDDELVGIGVDFLFSHYKSANDDFMRRSMTDFKTVSERTPITMKMMGKDITEFSNYTYWIEGDGQQFSSVMIPRTAVSDLSQQGTLSLGSDRLNNVFSVTLNNEEYEGYDSNLNKIKVKAEDMAAYFNKKTAERMKDRDAGAEINDTNPKDNGKPVLDHVKSAEAITLRVSDELVSKVNGFYMVSVPAPESILKKGMVFVTENQLLQATDGNGAPKVGRYDIFFADADKPLSFTIVTKDGETEMTQITPREIVQRFQDEASKKTNMPKEAPEGTYNYVNGHEIDGDGFMMS